MFRKVELWVVGLICVAAFVGMTLVSAIARKTADTAEGNKRFGLVGVVHGTGKPHAHGPDADQW